MAKKSFDIGDSLAAALGKASESDRPEQISYLELANLDSDENNFYSMDGIDELAANIELVGLQQPLRVRENPAMPGRFLITSGHRRRAALWTLYEEDPQRWATVPCIIEQAAASPELQELRLIMANADTRRMSGPDIDRQAQRVEMLLYQLQEQGSEVPGRMRDHVAEACKVSATKLATLKVIREKLLPEWKKQWESGKIPESSAYLLAKEDKTIQKQARQYVREPHRWSEQKFARLIRDLKAAPDKICTMCESGKCDYVWQHLFVEYVENRGNGCPSHSCCEMCYLFEKCQFSCPNLNEVKKKKKQDARAAKAATREAEKSRDQSLIDTAQTCWDRFAILRSKAGLSIKNAIKGSGRYYCKGWHDDRFEEYESGLRKMTPGAELPFGIRAKEVQTICKTADMLHCSTDYLLGHSDDLTPPAAAAQSGGWHRLSGSDKETPLPVNRPILTWAMTNVGEVYRAAIWTGSRFVDTKNGRKELTGLSFTRWIEIPDEGESFGGAETEASE